MKKILFVLLCCATFSLSAQVADTTVKALIITAHPDDETAFAATVYKITHELKGIVDLAVITNGEAGYKYSTLAEPYYNLKLTDEAMGRKYLPTIRKKELMNAGNIIGIGKYFFMDQLDNHYTLDADTVLKQIWDVTFVKRRLTEIIRNGNYDFIFCLLPTEGTHGHHKGATILALQTVNELPAGKKPIVLAAGVSSKTDTTVTTFKGLDAYPITTITHATSEFSLDRNVAFGYKNSLNYKVIVNWEIAEHKSQGTMQLAMGRGDNEVFWYFDLNDPAGRSKVQNLFDCLARIHP